MNCLPRTLRILPVLLAVLATAAHAQSVRWDPAGGQLGFNQVSDLALVFKDCEPSGDVNLPSVAGLEFGNPSVSQQRSFSFGFGNGSQSSITYTLTYPVRPTRRATLAVPSFTVQTNKGSVTVPAARFDVGEATVGRGGTGPTLADVASARLSVPDNTFWAGEVFPITYTLSVVKRYFHSLASSLEWQPAPIVAEEWSKPEGAEALVAGERRLVATQQTRAYAKEPGNYTLRPATQTINVITLTTGFFQQPIMEPRQIMTQATDITVKPLPPPPSDFSKAVGQFTLVSKVIPEKATPGEPITWTVELSGVGNWPDIPGLPSREVSNDFKVVQPKSKRTMKDGALFEGTLSEDVVLVPVKQGSYTLGPVRFTYFDPKAGAYRTLDTGSTTITVGPAPAVSPGPAPSFSLPGPAPSAGEPAVAPAAPPPPPGRLPRDPLPEAGRALAPLAASPFWSLVAIPPVIIVIAGWLTLAALRSRLTDPERRRREARSRLAAIVAEIRTAPGNTGLPAASLRRWQQETAALWRIGHAAPAADLLRARVELQSEHAGEAWARLWQEADQRLHGRDRLLPDDWALRAEGALKAVRVPGWQPASLFALRNLLPVIAAGLLIIPSSGRAADPAEAYRNGDFPAAETAWRAAVATAPGDWAARNNLGLALAQQDKWAEATAHWASAFLHQPRNAETRWNLALGLQHSGMAPPTLVDLSRGHGAFGIARLASPGGWQVALIVAAILLAAAVVVLLLHAYGRLGGWSRPAAFAAAIIAVVLAGTATLSLETYDQLADPGAAIIWKQSLLRSVPTEADSSQKTTPLAPGSIATVDRTFFGWSHLVFSGGQAGWARTDDLLLLYR